MMENFFVACNSSITMTSNVRCNGDLMRRLAAAIQREIANRSGILGASRKGAAIKIDVMGGPKNEDTPT